MLADVEERNQKLGSYANELDTLLAATLDVDDFVDLDSLRTEAVHPPFPLPELEIPLPAPIVRAMPDKPILEHPAPPTGFSALVGSLLEFYERAESTEHLQSIRYWPNEHRVRHRVQ